jgi:pimeloyl-ACP methyl ester carboxylesterase
MIRRKDTYFCTMEKWMLFKNTKISYTDSGKGAVVVLLHGFLENKHMWKEIIPVISRNKRVLAIDLLGHGHTECLGYIHPMELMADAVAAVLKTLRIRKITLIGHSMGGYVSLALSEKNPEMIRGLCLLNSTATSDDNSRKKLRERANKMAQINLSNIVRMSFINLFSEKSKEVFNPEIQLALSEALQTSLHGYRACQEGMKIRPNRLTVLKNNHFKKLFILGEKDPVLPVNKGIKEAEETQSKTVVLSGGHMSHIENSDKLIKVLNTFIRRSISY